MANITMDLQDFNSLMAVFAQGSRPREAMDLYNAGRTKAGQPTSNGPDNVVVSPTGYDQADGTSAQVTVTNILTAIEAAA
ncbi:hypothetical protein [Streptomyces werraensis]|uniref:hypothetical protein n=1 Tax=Streptomyces werraensis TaxID=68284 RepID=UPI003805A992